jgi:glycosyltransferase involved in cell wall biosynthesis
MRILLVTSMVPQAEGAGAIPELLHAQVAGLREHHDITLVTSFGDLRGQAEAALDLRRSGLDVHFLDGRRSSASFARYTRARFKRTWRWSTTQVPWRAVCASTGLQPILDRAVARRSFDVVAIEEHPVATLRFPPGVPIVFTEHEAHQTEPADWRQAPARERPATFLAELDQRRWDAFHRRIWERVDRLQVFTKCDAAFLAEKVPAIVDRVRVNPFGLCLPPAVNPAAEEPDTLLFAGTFSHLPNRDAAEWLAREIMPLVLSRRPQARLRIVGAGPPPRILALAGPSVEVVADVPSMRPYIEAAAVVLAPVRTGGGMRMKVLQALAAGKPTVTTPRGLEGFDVFESDPPLAVADSAEEMAVAIADLLAKPEKRYEQGRQARAFAERYHSPAPWAERLETVYAEAIGSGGAKAGA